MSDSSLSPQQLTVIGALSAGATMTAAAQQAGIHRNTINNWRRNSPPFQLALSQAQYDKALCFREKAEELFDLALDAIRDILTNPKTPASVRLRAALAIVNTASTPPVPQKQVELDIQPETSQSVHKSAQSPTDIRANSCSLVADSSHPLHNSAQPIPPHHHKIGRNDLCPCGSGKKYKRCCLGKPPVRPEFVQRLASAA